MATTRIPMPPAEMNGVPPAQPSWWHETWHRLLQSLAYRRRDETVREHQLVQEVLELRRDLWQRDNEIHALKTQINIHQSEIEILQRQRDLMAEVHELDRARVAADQAAYGQAIALHEMFKSQR